MGNKYYSSLDICNNKKFNIHKSRLRVWIVNGYVSPETEVLGGGNGGSKYTAFDICCIETFRKLVDTGISRKRSGEIINNLRDITRDVFIDLATVVYRDGLENPDVYPNYSEHYFTFDVNAIYVLNFKKTREFVFDAFGITK